MESHHIHPELLRHKVGCLWWDAAMNLILNAIEANFDFRDVTDRLPLLRFMEHSSQRRQSAVGFRVGAGNFNCSVKSRSVCRGQTGSPEVNDHLHRDISQFTFAPGLYLPSHRSKLRCIRSTPTEMASSDLVRKDTLRCRMAPRGGKTCRL